MSHHRAPTRTTAAILAAALLTSGCSPDPAFEPWTTTPTWAVTRADLDGYLPVPTEADPAAVSLSWWGQDACLTNSYLHRWIDVAYRYGGTYESHQIPDHPDHPFTAVIQMTSDIPVWAKGVKSPRSSLHRLWVNTTETCTSPTYRLDGTRLSFEVLGTEFTREDSGDTPLFGWRAVMQGPWEEPLLGNPPRSGDQVHIEIWYTLVDKTTLVVAGTQSAEAPTLDARELLDTVARRVHENPPDPRWTHLDNPRSPY